MAPTDDPRDNSNSSPHHVTEMPLFPLDLVLFPGMKIGLHIFEERYKTMIARCLEDDRPFGIVLRSPNQPSDPDPRKTKTYRIGCSAQITSVEHLDEGEYNIEIEGIERFRVVEQHEVEPYRTGIVEPLYDRKLTSTEIEIAEDLADEVEGLMKEFLTRQLEMMNQRIVEFDLPDDPQVLSFITACILPVENADKQTLLELTDPTERLTSERDILSRAITRLRRAAAAGQNKRGGNDDDSRMGDGNNSFEPIQADRYRDYMCVN